MESFFAEIEDGKLIGLPNRFQGKHKVMITLLENGLDFNTIDSRYETLITASAGKAFDEFNEDEIEYKIEDLKTRY